MLLEEMWTLQDLSGRPHLSFDVNPLSDRIGTYDTQLLEHFFQSLANTSGMTLHIRSLHALHMAQSSAFLECQMVIPALLSACAHREGR